MPMVINQKSRIGTYHVSPLRLAPYNENEEAAVEMVTDKLNRFPEQYYNIRDSKFASK